MGIALRPLRLLTQIELVLEVNQLRSVSTEVVEAARDSLVIGQDQVQPCPPIRQITPHNLRPISPQTTVTDV
jgi:hypothetical protein